MGAFFKGLLCGGDQNASMAKTAFWLAFGLAMVFWGLGRDLAPSHEHVIMAVLAYTLGGKAAWNLGRRKAERESARVDAAGQD